MHGNMWYKYKEREARVGALSEPVGAKGMRKKLRPLKISLSVSLFCQATEMGGRSPE
jgi:hypothetical protein